MDNNFLEYLAKTMSTEEGRAFIWQFLIISDVDQRSQVSDPIFMARHEGQRSVGLSILRAIRAISANDKHTDGYIMEAFMRREAAEKMARDRDEEIDF